MQNRLDDLVKGLLSGDRLALARLISRVESRHESLNALMQKIYPHTGGAQIWGITGPPGSGKSTLVDQITTHLRKKKLKVAVMAIDPSSPFSGGAILGDRIRMQRHAEDSGVFIRSLGTRGKHGGLSQSAKEGVLLLDAAGFDVILVETAGVGQTELDILRLAQTVIVVLVPESGDGIQVMKAGLMEIADLFVVNKADRPQADQLVRELVTVVGMPSESLKPGAKGWPVPVLKTEAVRDRGVDRLVAAALEHQEYLTRTGARALRTLEFLKNEVADILLEQHQKRVDQVLASDAAVPLLEGMLARRVDPYLMAQSLTDILNGNS